MAQTLFTVSFSLSFSLSFICHIRNFCALVEENKNEQKVFRKYFHWTRTNGIERFFASKFPYKLFNIHVVCVCGAVVLYVQRNDDAPKEEKERKSI